MEEGPIRHLLRSAKTAGSFADCYWMVAGALTIAPLTIAARLGRSLLELMLLVHTIEAGYTTVRAWAAGLNMRPWFLRTIVLGSLAVFTLEITLRRNIGEKEPA